MPKLYLHIINSVMLLAGGLLGYITQPGQTLTMVLAAIGGAVLLLFTKMLKKYNQFAEHTVAAILLLLLVLFVLRLNLLRFELGGFFILLIVMAVGCFITLTAFIFGFIKEWRKGKTGL